MELPQEKEAKGKYFFKVLVGDFASKIRLPPAFARYIHIGKSEDAILKTDIGGTWIVKVEHSSMGLLFHTGWTEFVKSHGLQEGEFLVFRYNGDLNFDVMLLGIDGCERVACHGPEGGNKVVPTVKKEMEELYGSPEHRTLDDPVGSTGIKVDNIDQQQVPSKPSLTSNQCHTSRGKLTGERARAFEAALSLNLSRPHFTTTMLESSVSGIFVVHVPIRFFEAFPWRNNSIVTLQNESGALWRASFAVFGKYGRITKGWREFAVAHELKKGDICVFELIQKKKPVLKVHIFKLDVAVDPRGSMGTSKSRNK